MCNNVFFEELIDNISESIKNSFEPSISFSDIFSCSHLLIIKSIRDTNFEIFLEKIQQFLPSCKVSFLCEKDDIKFFESKGISNDKLVFHNGRIHKTDIKNIDESFISSIDKVLFCNYSDFNSSYANVEEFCLEIIKKNTNVELYSYNFAENVLNKFLNPFVHCSGIKLLENLFNWLYAIEFGRV